ncbi:hypothetical protein M436DRAFT_42788 [Aureobasidium namibiae CBS 147.97]|uniref:Myb-like domain-containing protein n=1 Tax=Aureobasidium namibiae CBS 147.97 TaxID=1043004 RepID=A0A074WPA3_9PEZI
MSDNGADIESDHDGEVGINNLQDDSGSEYQSEDDNNADDQSDDEARSVQSVHSEKSNRSARSGSGRKSTPKEKSQLRSTKNTKGTYSDAYREFYNTQLEDLVRPFQSIAHALPASEIGVVVWTPLEKEILFQRVAAIGKDNIKDISNAIRTKSETEVRQYLSLLDQGTIEGNVTKALPVFSAADVSAAFEVTKQSEDLLEEYADGLAQYQTRSDQKREQKRHGDYWLLTEEIAQEVEEQVMARDESYLKSKLHDEDEDEDADDDTDVAKSDQEAAETDPKAKPESRQTDTEDESYVPRKADSERLEPDQQPSQPLDEIMVPAAELLDLPMWLRLSKLLMYQPPGLGDSWDAFTTGHQTPSMYHTAFQDYHNLTVSLTRRVVQATIFQTMTRLRARDKDHPSAAVTANDVRAASEILDLKPDRRRFWGSVPRRHGLRVYERGSKFSRGQSRAGTELDLEEAEERLGVGLMSTTTTEMGDDVVQADEDEMEEDVFDPDQYYEDPELWTEASEAEEEIPITILDDQESNDSGEEDAAYHAANDEEAQDAARKKQYRKGRMEKNFQKAHDAYLEAVDQEISRVQEIEMWDALGVAPPNNIKDEEVEIPRQPVIKRRLSDTAKWRNDLEYQSPWELDFDAVQPGAFVSMHKRSEQAKKRRRRAYDYLEQEGLVELPQYAPEAVVVRKKPKPVEFDTEIDEVLTGSAAIATTEVFDGVPRKKLPNPIVNKPLSRASSVRESSHDSSVSQRSAKATALINRLASRAPSKKIEEDLRKAEEARQAEEQAQEEKRQTRAARKALSEEERLALKKDEQDQRTRKEKENRRRQSKEQERLAKEEEQLAKEERKRAKAEKRKAVDEEPVQNEPSVEQPGEATSFTRSRSKKPKRKSGF